MTTTQGTLTDVRSFPPYMHFGLTPFWGEHEIAAVGEFDEVGDVIFLGDEFPPGSYWPSFLGALALRVDFPDLDSNGTPLVEADVGFADDDGTIDVLLIDDSAAGQTGAVDDADANASGLFTDISGKRLCVKIGVAPATANTAAVGQKIEFCGLYANGVVKGAKDPSQ